jgi:hypothetical protein
MVSSSPLVSLWLSDTSGLLETMTFECCVYIVLASLYRASHGAVAGPLLSDSVIHYCFTITLCYCYLFTTATRTLGAFEPLNAHAVTPLHHRRRGSHEQQQTSTL